MLSACRRSAVDDGYGRPALEAGLRYEARRLRTGWHKPSQRPDRAPDAEAFEQASHKNFVPERLSGTMAFMFETCCPLSATAYASQPDVWPAAAESDANLPCHGGFELDVRAAKQFTLVARRGWPQKAWP
ncbi:homogentisate 1,2-dioxygenase domain-containing protein [Bradyrhizobium sp. HKCCYLS1011]|uniref:homogentisate 1,2-dioxygenase domain-containing protein n=1 Tax=Bradyrhizobium sp. HKCCYLS1011 TaxID=3420733 RepID=UPI003EC05AFA